MTKPTSKKTAAETESGGAFEDLGRKLDQRPEVQAAADALHTHKNNTNALNRTTTTCARTPPTKSTSYVGRMRATSSLACWNWSASIPARASWRRCFAAGLPGGSSAVRRPPWWKATDCRPHRRAARSSFRRETCLMPNHRIVDVETQRAKRLLRPRSPSRVRLSAINLPNCRGSGVGSPRGERMSVVSRRPRWPRRLPSDC